MLKIMFLDCCVNTGRNYYTNFNLQIVYTNFLQDLSLFEKSDVSFDFINYIHISFSFTDKPYENYNKTLLFSYFSKRLHFMHILMDHTRIFL